jgi:hypothetical protein
MAVPLVKDWFEKLSAEERVKCLSTVDAEITDTIMSMCKNLLHKWMRRPESERKRFPWYCDGLFVLKDKNYGVGGNHDDYTWTARQTEHEDPFVVIQEMKLMEKVILTDTVDDNDTLSICSSLL